MIRLHESSHNNSGLQFLLNPAGSRGDVHPFLALGLELRARGHKVRFLTNPLHRAMVTSFGFPFTGIGRKLDMNRNAQEFDLHRNSNLWKVALRWGATGTMRETFAKLTRCSTAGKSVIVSGHLGFGARIAAESHEIPIATVLLSPYMIRNLYDSPAMPPMWLGDQVPLILKRLQFWVADKFFIDPVIARPTNEFRKELGLEPVQRLMNDWFLSPDLVLCMFPRLFMKDSVKLPSHFKVVGSALADPPATAESAAHVSEFIQAGDPPVVLLPGSIGPVSSRFYQVALTACQQLHQRVLMLEPNPHIVPPDLPSSVLHLPYVPLADVLPRCKAIVHSGGVGTTCQSLANGTPQLILPQVNDQFDNAARAQRLGVANCLDPRHLSVDRFQQELLSTLSDDQMKESCEQHAGSFSQQSAVDRACDELEQYAIQRLSEKSGKETRHL